MKIHRNLNTLPTFRKAVITIGSFDGVHQGHQKIISMMKTEAERIDGETVIITFDPHPRKIVKGGTYPISLLTSIEEKADLIDELGIDHMVIVPFTGDFSKMTPEEYVETFLVHYFHPSSIIVGYDHRFGSNRSGDFHLLEKLGKVYQYGVIEIPEHVLHSISISSTYIRTAIAEGRLEDANEYLGYPYLIAGEVIHGDKRGRTIGFPTANMGEISTDKLIPVNGVYAVKVKIQDRPSTYNGMMNIGTRPTVSGEERRIEVHILNLNEDLYGQHIKVHLYKKIREEVKFGDLMELRTQIQKDQSEITRFFENN
ncbi:MAG: bifunctional riboflavin kinase/FAD synthetase [Chitinophagaceae bacterium]